jgi:rhodanese-related sulfurtransferase
MKSRHLFAALAVGAEARKVSSAEAAKLVADGKAILVDVREPAEWAETGVARPAVLLPKSDFDGAQKQWKEFLGTIGDKEILLYCSRGIRAGRMAAKLSESGVKAASAGSLKDWTDAGLPVRQFDQKK